MSDECLQVGWTGKLLLWSGVLLGCFCFFLPQLEVFGSPLDMTWNCAVHGTPLADPPETTSSEQQDKKPPPQPRADRALAFLFSRALPFPFLFFLLVCCCFHEVAERKWPSRFAKGLNAAGIVGCLAFLATAASLGIGMMVKALRTKAPFPAAVGGMAVCVGVCAIAFLAIVLKTWRRRAIAMPFAVLLTTLIAFVYFYMYGILFNRMLSYGMPLAVGAFGLIMAGCIDVAASIHLRGLRSGGTAQGGVVQWRQCKKEGKPLPSLAGVDLSEADFSDVDGLGAEDLAGADLTGATMPEGFSWQKKLAEIKETSRHARYLFLTTAAACFYCLTAVIGTKDKDLFGSGETHDLPFIGVSVSTTGFYLAAPAVLLVVYMYFHVYLQRLWEKFGKLPLVFEDGVSVDQRAYPWLLNGLVRGYAPRLKARSDVYLFGIQKLCLDLGAYFGVPLVISVIWFRYLRRQMPQMIIVHLILMLTAWAACLLFRRTTRETLSFESEQRRDQCRRFRRMRNVGHWLLLCAVAVFCSFSPGAFNEVAPLNLRNAKLSGKNLRGLNLSKAILIEAELNDADMTGCLLRGARLRGAKLQYAKLNKADLADADLTGADVKFATVDAAYLNESRIHNAKELTKIRSVKDAYLDKATTRKLDGSRDKGDYREGDWKAWTRQMHPSWLLRVGRERAKK